MLVLKSPVQSKCEDAGLRGCPELTDGVLLFVDGDQGQGTKKIMDGAAKNAPDPLRKFAQAIRELKNVPGAGDYVAPLLKIAALLAGPGAAKASPGKPESDAAPVDSACPPGWPLCGTRGAQKSSTSDDAAARKTAPTLQAVVTAADTDAWRIRTAMSSPSTTPGNISCGDMTGSGHAVCVKVIDGPFILTDVYVLGGCQDELFVSVGSGTWTTGPARWILDHLSAIHGGRFQVKDRESLYVGQWAQSEAKMHTSRDCRVTWSGFRPYVGQGDWSVPE